MQNGYIDAKNIILAWEVAILFNKVTITGSLHNIFA